MLALLPQVLSPAIRGLPICNHHANNRYRATTTGKSRGSTINPRGFAAPLQPLATPSPHSRKCMSTKPQRCLEWDVLRCRATPADGVARRDLQDTGASPSSSTAQAAKPTAASTTINEQSLSRDLQGHALKPPSHARDLAPSEDSHNLDSKNSDRVENPNASAVKPQSNGVARSLEAAAHGTDLPADDARGPDDLLARELHAHALGLTRRGDVPGAALAFSQALSRFPDNTYLLTSAAIFHANNACRLEASLDGSQPPRGDRGTGAGVEELMQGRADKGAFDSGAGERFEMASDWDDASSLVSGSSSSSFASSSPPSSSTSASSSSSSTASSSSSMRGGKTTGQGAPSRQPGTQTTREEHLQRARELFRRATRGPTPPGVEVWQAWGVMEARPGGEGIERARELFKEAAAVDGSHAPVWQAWAIAEERAGHSGRAESLFAKAVKADPSHAPSWQAFALFEASRGDISSARQLFQRARLADPTHVPTLQAWACLEARRGDPLAARRLYKKAYRVCVAAARSMNSAVDGAATARASDGDGTASVLNSNSSSVSDRFDGGRSTVKGDDIFRDPFDLEPDVEDDGLDWEEGDYTSRSASTSSLSWSPPASPIVPYPAAQGTPGVGGGSPGADGAGASRAGYGEGCGYHQHLPPLLRAWAGFEARQRRVNSARQLLRQACALAPHDARGWLQWGDFERRVGRAGRAAELLQEGLARVPTSVHLKHALAQLCAKDPERAPEAKSLLRQIVAADPLNGHGWHALGTLELQAGRFEQARHYFQMGACGAGNPLSAGCGNAATGAASSHGTAGGGGSRRNKTWSPTKQQRGDSGGKEAAAAGFAGGMAAAVPAASSSIVKEVVAPRNARCFGAWAALEAQMGRYDLAREIYREGSLTEEGQRVSYLRAWGLFEKNRGNTGAARSLFRSCTRQDPSDPKLWLLWGQMERKVGNLDAARQCFEKGLQARYKYSFIWQAWARMEADTGHPEEARSLFERGCEACAEDAPLWMEYALFELRWALERPQREARAAAVAAAAAATATGEATSADSSMAEEDNDAEMEPGLAARGPLDNAKATSTSPVPYASADDEAAAREGPDGGRVKGGSDKSPLSMAAAPSKRELRLRPLDVVLIRGLFEKGGAIDPPHVPLYQAWARFEERWGSALYLARVNGVLEENMAPTNEGY